MTDIKYLGLEKPQSKTLFENLAFEMEEKTNYTLSEIKEVIFNFVSIHQGQSISQDDICSDLKEVILSCHEVDSKSQMSFLRSTDYFDFFKDEIKRSLEMKRDSFRLKQELAKLSMDMPLPKRNRKNTRSLAKKQKRKN